MSKLKPCIWHGVVTDLVGQTKHELQSGAFHASNPPLSQQWGIIFVKIVFPTIYVIFAFRNLNEDHYPIPVFRAIHLHLAVHVKDEVAQVRNYAPLYTQHDPDYLGFYDIVLKDIASGYAEVLANIKYDFNQDKVILSKDLCEFQIWQK